MLSGLGRYGFKADGLNGDDFCPSSSIHNLPSPSIVERLQTTTDQLAQRFLCPTLNAAVLVLEGLSFSALHFNLPQLKSAHILMLNLFSKIIVFSKHHLCLENNPKLLEADLKFSVIEVGMTLSYLGALKVIQVLDKVPLPDVQNSVSNVLNKVWTPLLQTAFALSHLFLITVRHCARN